MDIKCFGCGKTLRRVWEDEGSVEGEIRKISEPEVDAWDDGGVHLFVPGYGSQHDMDKIIIGICDDCIDKGLNEGTLILKESGL